MKEWAGWLIKEATERKSFAVLIGCFSFLLGVLAHSFFDIEIGFFWLYNAVLAAAICLLLFWKNPDSRAQLTTGRGKKMRLIFLGAFFVIAGLARFDLSVPQNDYRDIFGRDLEVRGLVAEEPANKIDKQELVIVPEEIGGQKFSGHARILLVADLYPKYLYGQELGFSCKLLELKEFPDFDYAKYLSIQNIGAQCFRPAITVLGEGGNPVLRKIFSAKNFLIEKINLSLHEPLASFLGGLILGAKNSIPNDLSANFKNTGTAHIVAISGWNITFLAQLFMPLLFVLRIRRPQAFYLMSGAIFIYALFAGFTPSVLRAAIMGAVALYAQKSGRLNSAGRALLYSAALMFLINPRLAYDAGFWLSATAAFGLIYFSGIAKKIFHRLPRGVFLENFATTFSAVIFTLPVSLYVFGTVSLWALPVNLIILPFVALAIPLALPAIFLSAASAGLAAQILFLPAAAVMDFVIKVINFFGALPFGVWQIRINFWLMLAAYLALAIFTVKSLKEQNEEF